MIEVMEKPDFILPSFFDSSMMETFAKCPQKFFLEYCGNFRAFGESTHLVFGKAFARGAEVVRKSFFFDKKSVEESLYKGLVALVKEYGHHDCGHPNKTLLRCVHGLFHFFIKAFPLEEETLIPVENGVEYSMALPLPIIHPTTGEPVLYVGKADQICKAVDGSGEEFFEDDKTTTSLGPTWVKQWEKAGQFTGYQYMAREYGRRVTGTRVRGISFLSKTCEAVEIDVYKSDYALDIWYKNLLQRVTRVVDSWKQDSFEFLFGKSCSDFSGCPFFDFCDMEDRLPWIKTNMVKVKPWDPMEK